MGLQVFSSEIVGSFDEVLPNASSLAEWSLWLRPDGGQFTADDIAQVAHAFIGLRGIVWHAARGGASSPRIQEYKRALGMWSASATNWVRRTTIEDEGVSNKTYSDVVWVSPESYGNLAALLGRSTASMDSATAFIPGSVDAGRTWADSVFGLIWLFLSRDQFAGPPHPHLDVAAVLRCYVQTTVAIGGAPALILVQHAVARGLVYFGDRHVLEPARMYLESHAQTMTVVDFEHWLRSPLYLPMFP